VEALRQEFMLDEFQRQPDVSVADVLEASQAVEAGCR
jgi:hypothetical protein